MQRLPDNIAGADVLQWLAGGVFFVDHEILGAPEVPPAREPATLVRVGTESSNRAISYRLLRDSAHLTPVRRSNRENGIHSCPFTSVYVHWPRLGSFNIPGLPYAVYVSRIAERQYCRTMRSDVLHVSVPRRWDVERSGLSIPLRPSRLSASNSMLLYAVCRPEYISPEEGLHRIRAGEIVSFAADPSLIFAGDPSGKTIVYYNGTMVGSMHNGEYFSTCTDKISLLVRKKISKHNVFGWR